MKDFVVYINEKLKITKDVLKQNKHNYYPKTKDELRKLVEQLIKERGDKADLNDINTFEIKDMSELFKNSDFNGNISKWDVSNVNNMQGMFIGSLFNGNISDWDVRNVEDMSNMFYDAYFFTGDLSKWNVSNVTKIDYIFEDCPIKEKHKPKFKIK